MQRPPRKPRSSPFDRATLTLVLGGGLWSAIVNLSLFLWALNSGRAESLARTMVFSSLVLLEFFKAYSFRSSDRSMLHRPFANRWLNAAILWELALLGVILYWPVMQSPFGTEGLRTQDWMIVLPAAFSICPVLEILKAWIRRHAASAGSEK